MRRPDDTSPAGVGALGWGGCAPYNNAAQDVVLGVGLREKPGRMDESERACEHSQADQSGKTTRLTTSATVPAASTPIPCGHRNIAAPPMPSE